MFFADHLVREPRVRGVDPKKPVDDIAVIAGQVSPELFVRPELERGPPPER